MTHRVDDLVGGADRPEALGVDDEIVKPRVVDVLVVRLANGKPPQGVSGVLTAKPQVSTFRLK